MATRAESLIRQFCTQRRTEIENSTKALQNALPEKIPIAQLPPPIRQQIHRLRSLRTQAEAIEVRLTKRGFSSYELHQSRSTLSNPERSVAYARISKRRAERLAKIEAVQQAAYVQAMGRTPGEARIIVEELQKVLAKI